MQNGGILTRFPDQAQLLLVRFKNCQIPTPFLRLRPWSPNVSCMDYINSFGIALIWRLKWVVGYHDGKWSRVTYLLLRKVKKVDLFWPWKEVSQVSENFLQKLLLLQNNLHLYSECKRFEKNLGLACLENLRLQWRYIYLLGKK